MDIELAAYFSDKSDKMYNSIELTNKNAKPVTFATLVRDFNFDNFIGEFTNELLKCRILCEDIIQKFKFILSSQKYELEGNFWCICGKAKQHVGRSLETFLEKIKVFKGLKFVYSIICSNYFIVLTGITDQLNYSKLYVYFNNKNYPYVDLINLFKKEFLDVNSEIIFIKKLKLPQRLIYSQRKEIPKVSFGIKCLSGKDSFKYYSIIENNQKSLGLSHIIAWDLDNVKFNENKKYSIEQTGFVELDELIILSFSIRKHH